MRRLQRQPRLVALVIFPGIQVLDVAGPVEVFANTNALLSREGRSLPGYEIELLAEVAGPLETAGPMTIVAERALGRPRRDVDTLVVSGGRGVNLAITRPKLVRWVAETARHSRRICSVCSGAFLLAEAGLLDGCRVATHWARCDELARRYPTLKVDPDALYVRDGKRFTSAGITAGIDLALSLVEEDFGRRTALAVARQLVVFRYRSGSQRQFSSHLAAQFTERTPLRDVQLFIVDNVASDLSVRKLARRAGLSPRQFARAFGAEVGTTPAKYVENVRIDAARELLERGERAIKEIAESAGFGSEESMRRRFVARLGLSPSAYRERFGSTH